MLNLKRFGILLVLKTASRLASLCLLTTLAVQAQTYSVVYSFNGPPNDGAFANGELTQDASGNFYGTTKQGGDGNSGTIFKLDASGLESTLQSFGAPNVNAGGLPQGGLLLDTEDNLYGTATVAGPGGGAGTVFKFATNSTLKALHSFGFEEDGSHPESRLVTINGDLYGVTLDGGTIYKMTKGGTETILYRFTGGADGSLPENIIRDSAGNLYGIAAGGGGQVKCAGQNGCGTVWKFDTFGVFTVLYTFTGGIDGGIPLGRLILDAGDGSLRGTTEVGGDPTCDCGVVFRVDSSGNETVIHKFFGHGGGGEPSTGLLDVDGTLYGTTGFGGDLTCNPPYGCGVLYQIGKTGRYTVLHRFAGAATGDGAYNAIGALSLGADGSIYGATWYGGTGACTTGAVPGCGVIFKYTP
jgi:uncharacterized repeat protein (TIGR03803 family)